MNSKSAPATTIVIFGATGDLTNRKLVPALYNLFYDGYLSENFTILGVSRTKLSDQDFREKLKKSANEFSRRKLEDAKWEKFSRHIFYEPLDISKHEDFLRLKSRVDDLEKTTGEPHHKLYYLSIAPELFAQVASNLKDVGMVSEVNTQPKTSLVVEKPFGTDMESAKLLNSKLSESFDEQQIFRIDHYVAKETVQNILVFRFANGMFEPLWNRKYIDRIEITVSESIGVEGRSGYFDQTGILRDMVQNHILQMLSLLCIEPPLSLTDADSIRNEKVKVLQSITKLKDHEVDSRVVRGQYTWGIVNGERVPGYRELDGVSHDTKTETYVALSLNIDNWRWSGVPIYIRVGKRLSKKLTTISVFFQRTPESLFAGIKDAKIAQNELRIEVQPNEGISLKINSKPPGLQMQVLPVDMDFTYRGSFATTSTDAYERLILDAMRGDATLFTRSDEIEESWKVLKPIMDHWQSHANSPLFDYAAGSAGPRQASKILSNHWHDWSLL